MNETGEWLFAVYCIGSILLFVWWVFWKLPNDNRPFQPFRLGANDREHAEERRQLTLVAKIAGTIILAMSPVILYLMAQEPVIPESVTAIAGVVVFCFVVRSIILLVRHLNDPRSQLPPDPP